MQINAEEIVLNVLSIKFMLQDSHFSTFFKLYLPLNRTQALMVSGKSYILYLSSIF
jgi:hypothetical protein